MSKADFEPRLSLKDVTIHEKKRVYQGHFAMDLYQVSYKRYDGGETPILAREIFERDMDAVAILPYDPVTDEIVFIEQFRPGALKDPVSPWIIEVVAGMIDEGETELEAACRELKEESGLTVAPEDLVYVNAVYPSPGGASERVTIYIARTDASHLIRPGGLDNENEDIRVFKAGCAEAFAMCANGRICNGATLVAVLNLQIHHDKIRQAFLNGVHLKNLA